VSGGEGRRADRGVILGGEAEDLARVGQRASAAAVNRWQSRAGCAPDRVLKTRRTLRALASDQNAWSFPEIP
jgi:hypothetical protein